jgi:hypothetical protein
VPGPSAHEAAGSKHVASRVVLRRVVHVTMQGCKRDPARCDVCAREPVWGLPSTEGQAHLTDLSNWYAWHHGHHLACDRNV